MDDIVDATNQRTMRSAAAVSIYSRSEGLSAPERAAMERVADHARGKAILDIGVGGGRTVTALRSISADYVGIDNSEAMIVACRRRFPDTRFELADARALPKFEDGSIFLAVFSCNGIGMVKHDDRIAIMREVYRILMPGGWFIFSTHNQNSPDHTSGFKFPQFEASRNPARLLVRAARFQLHTMIRLYNHSRLRRHDVRTAAYSMINDACHNYATMLYYISLQNQRLQLTDIGFQPDSEAYDLAGRYIDGDSNDSSITLIAKK